jgi:hypothetical protein
METTRNAFLGANLRMLPAELVACIRDYDPIYRDYYSRHVLQFLSRDVYNFWEDKTELCILLGKYKPNYREKIHYYYTMSWDIVPSISELDGGLSFMLD